jgi:hypothetical protein
MLIPRVKMIMILLPEILESDISRRNRKQKFRKSRCRVFIFSFKRTGIGRVNADLRTGLAVAMFRVMGR